MNRIFSILKLATVTTVLIFSFSGSQAVAEESFSGPEFLELTPGWDDGGSPSETDVQVIVPGTAVPFPECGFQDGVCGGSCPDGKSCKTVAGQAGAPETCSCQPTVACKLDASNPQCIAGDCALRNGEFRFCTSITAGGQNGCGCKADSCAVRDVNGTPKCTGSCSTGHCEGDANSCTCVTGCKFIIKDGAPACDGHCAGGQFCKLNDDNDACTCPAAPATPTATPNATPSPHGTLPPGGTPPPTTITPPPSVTPINCSNDVARCKGTADIITALGAGNTCTKWNNAPLLDVCDDAHANCLASMKCSKPGCVYDPSQNTNCPAACTKDTNPTPDTCNISCTGKCMPGDSGAGGGGGGTVPVPIICDGPVSASGASTVSCSVNNSCNLAKNKCKTNMQNSCPSGCKRVQNISYGTCGDSGGVCQVTCEGTCSK